MCVCVYVCVCVCVCDVFVVSMAMPLQLLCSFASIGTHVVVISFSHLSTELCKATDLDPDCIECGFDASGKPICLKCKGDIEPTDGKCPVEGKSRPCYL